MDPSHSTSHIDTLTAAYIAVAAVVAVLVIVVLWCLYAPARCLIDFVRGACSICSIVCCCCYRKLCLRQKDRDGQLFTQLAEDSSL